MASRQRVHSGCAGDADQHAKGKRADADCLRTEDARAQLDGSPGHSERSPLAPAGRPARPRRKPRDSASQSAPGLSRRLPMRAARLLDASRRRASGPGNARCESGMARREQCRAGAVGTLGRRRDHSPRLSCPARAPPGRHPSAGTRADRARRRSNAGDRSAALGRASAARHCAGGPRRGGPRSGCRDSGGTVARIALAQLAALDARRERSSSPGDLAPGVARRRGRSDAGSSPHVRRGGTRGRAR